MSDPHMDKQPNIETPFKHSPTLSLQMRAINLQSSYNISFPTTN